jgi:thioredoxin 1
MGTAKVTDASFDAEVLNASEPVVVDFWAEWCGPCRQIGPALEEIASELKGKVKIAKLNIDENQKVTEQFHIRAIPTLLIFKGGKVVGEHRGAAPKQKLASWIKSSIAAA